MEGDEEDSRRAETEGGRRQRNGGRERKSNDPTAGG